MRKTRANARSNFKNVLFPQKFELFSQIFLEKEKIFANMEILANVNFRQNIQDSADSDFGNRKKANATSFSSRSNQGWKKPGFF
jgi:hypothetical protein